MLPRSLRLVSPGSMASSRWSGRASASFKAFLQQGEDQASYFPEGLAGDIEKEFEFSGKEQWMHRDASLVVTSWIDAFKNSGKKGSRGVAAGDGTGPYMNIYRYGANVMSDVVDSRLVVEAFSGKLDLMSNDGLGGMPDRMMLIGERGSGKSVVLNQAVLHARKSGWLCMFVPDGFDHSHGGVYVEPTPGKRGLYDNTMMSAELLRGFYRAHADQLNDIPIEEKDVLKKYERHIEKFREKWDLALKVPGRENLNFTEMRAIILGEDYNPDEHDADNELLRDFDFYGLSPSSVGDLVRMGLAFHEYSGLAVMDVVSELKALKRDGMPVLFAVDQFNAWEDMSAFHYRDKALHSRDICVPAALSFLSRKKDTVAEWKVANGLCIAATSFKHAADGGLTTYRDSKSSMPLVVEVPEYSAAEFASALDNYDLRRMTERAPSPGEVEAFRMAVGNNPEKMRLEITKYFYRLSADDDVGGIEAGLEEDDEGLEAAHALAEDSTKNLLDSVIGERQRSPSS